MNSNFSLYFFPHTNISSWQKAKSNASHVIISQVETNMSGRYTCEVSVDAPTFQTTLVSGEMEVVGKQKKINIFLISFRMSCWMKWVDFFAISISRHK
jgi:hypothetical protein